MKVKFNFSSLSALIVLTAVLFFNACQKDYNSDELSKEFTLKTDSYATDILSFIEKYKDNSDSLEAVDSISVDTAIKYLEASMNLMYTFYVKTSALYSESSKISITAGKNKVSDINVSEAIEIIEDSIKMHYLNASYTSKKLIAVILDYRFENDVHKIKITSYTGNTTYTALHPPYDWYEGRFKGNCDGTIFGTDAAEEIQKVVQGLYWEEPPAGTGYFWPNPKEKFHYVGPDNPNSFLDYENDPDPNPINYKDYIIFYMVSNEANYEDPHCMLGNDEMPFYKAKYRGLVDDDLASGNNFKFKECDYNGIKKTFDAPYNYTVLRHELKNVVGKRYGIKNGGTNPVCNYPVNIN